MEASPNNHDRPNGFAVSRLLTAQPDPVLCRLAARGSAGAYEALYARYRTPITAFIYHSLDRSATLEDVEDIAQDTFTRAFAGLSEKRIDGSFKSWIYTIARNRTIDHQRSMRENVVSLDSDSPPEPPAPQTEQPADRVEQRAQLAWLVAAVSELPERQREALLLRELGGLSHEHIAQQLDTTVSATKKLIGRGRDGVERAAIEGGFRTGPRQLSRDLALAAPIIPLVASVASFGVAVGTSTGAATLAKVAATVLAVAAVGGGSVAVETKVADRRGASTADVTSSSVADAATPPSRFVRTSSATGDDRRESDDRDDRDDDDRGRDDRDDRDDDRDDRNDDRDDRGDRDEDRHESGKSRSSRSEHDDDRDDAAEIEVEEPEPEPESGSEPEDSEPEIED